MPDSDNTEDTEMFTDNPEAFTNDLPLTDVFGDHPRTRIISALLSESEDPTTDFTVSEITRISGVVDDAVTEHLDDLRTFGLVVETDELEDQPTYRLDDERAVVADIRQLYSDLFEEMP